LVKDRPMTGSERDPGRYMLIRQRGFTGGRRQLDRTRTRRVGEQCRRRRRRYLTTVTRGRLEREEAWRTRLIEAAVSLNDALVAMMVAAGSWIPYASRGESPLRDESGELTSKVREEITEGWDLREQVESPMSRLGMLFVPDPRRTSQPWLRCASMASRSASSKVGTAQDSS
jgi:hypothetical protein